MAPRSGRIGRALALGGWFLVAVGWLGTVLLQARLRSIGRQDLADSTAVTVLFVTATTVASTVGAALAIRRPRHPAGWLLLSLSGTVVLAGLTGAYGLYGAVARPGSRPGAAFAAVYSDASFVPWLVLLTLILLTTPTGRLPSPAWRWVGWSAVGAGALMLPAKLLSARPLEGRLRGVHNPAASVGQGVLDVVKPVAGLVLVCCVLAGAGSLVLRFRRATGVERLQLRWVTIAAVPMVLALAGTVYASATDQPVLLDVFAGVLIAALPTGVALAVTQYHLYDVDRLLSLALTYALLSMVLATSYGAVAVVVGQLAGDLSGGSQLAAALGTLAAISIARPARDDLQKVLDRRFNRREHDAVAVAREFLRNPSRGSSVEQALRAALGDPALDVAYWIAGEQRWVSQAGSPALPGPEHVAVTRRGELVAAVSFDPGAVEVRLVRTLVTEVQAELENACLRAAIALQLVEVRGSRARIVAAQVAERQRIERNLHDGAQQRLLALALNLRAAELSRDPGQAVSGLSSAVEEIRTAVAELRQLAHGLHPAVLDDDGLRGALEDLRQRLQVPLEVAATGERFSSEVETAAWYIACEAVTNAVKHGAPSRIRAEVTHAGTSVVVSVVDDGVGGADPGGRGLRGLSDRAEAGGGSLTVGSAPGGGTRVTAVLPCGS